MQGSELEGCGRAAWPASLGARARRVCCRRSPSAWRVGSALRWLTRRFPVCVAPFSLVRVTVSPTSQGPGCRLEAPSAPLRGFSLPSLRHTPPFRLSSRLSSCLTAPLLPGLFSQVRLFICRNHSWDPATGSRCQRQGSLKAHFSGAFPVLSCFCDVYSFHSACPAGR